MSVAPRKGGVNCQGSLTAPFGLFRRRDRPAAFLVECCAPVLSPDGLFPVSHGSLLISRFLKPRQALAATLHNRFTALQTGGSLFKSLIPVSVMKCFPLPFCGQVGFQAGHLPSRDKTPHCPVRIIPQIVEKL